MTKDKIQEFIDAKVAVTSVNDGWVFKFDQDTLQSLLDKAIANDGVAILFVKSPTMRGH